MKKIIAAILLISVACAFKSDQLFKTNLKITVRNELGNLEEGVAVQLFKSEKDYRNETNPATEVMHTDDKGDVKFKDLEPIIYFVNAEKGDKNNVGAGVQTDSLQEGKLNKITVIIE
ncbi:carboxypeptidase regulatory-like domain-containing protein [Fulvivirga sp. RKSG066]|uniref:carboxypeptidase regulatory-like domain-containing protein n=1 Tax=Fulvivirga aurantia TaxID=2529383 RepID=UPI0012BC9E63|nr:carboxypeptidase regulatory-like domain-containing protein [Fulvivirga aurantia]MTI21360.1 carboxypeptidase regulatory-like domain-containing protein [Fulvivirga aurantia]